MIKKSFLFVSSLALQIGISYLTFSSSATALSMRKEYNFLFGEIAPFTYTDVEGTTTTGPISLSLNSEEPSFLHQDFDAGTFIERLVADVVFDDGRGNLLNGVLELQFEGTFPSGGSFKDEIGTITQGVLNGAGQFNGTTFLGGSKRKHGKDCPSQGGWCWVFFVPPEDIDDPIIIAQLPAPPFLNVTDIPISGVIEVDVTVPEPTSTLSLLALGTLGVASTFKRKLKPSKKDETLVN